MILGTWASIVSPRKQGWGGGRALLPLVLVCAGTCGPAGDRAGVVEADSAGVHIVTSAAPAAEWSLGERPELSLGGSDGGPTEFFRIRDIAVLPGGRLALANGGTEEIRFFARDGTFLGAGGRAGQGPRDFRGLSWIVPRADSLLTYDSGNDRISVRSSDGTYGRSFRLEWHAGILVPVALLADGTLLGIAARHMTDMPRSGLVLDSALVSRYDLTGAFIDSIARFPHNQRVVRRAGDLQTTLGLPFSSSGAFVASPGGFCFAFGAAPEVKCFDLAGALRQIVRVAADPDPITRADIDAFWERELASDNEARVNALVRMRDEMVFPEAFPAFTRLLVDDGGRLWARAYTKPGAPHVEWLVFEHGRWVGRLRSAADFELMAVDGDRAIGVWRDGLGVEFVWVVRLERSGG